MKNATDAMKEARIADFLASVGALAIVMDVTVYYTLYFPNSYRNIIFFLFCSLMHCNTEGWILRNFVQLH